MSRQKQYIEVCWNTECTICSNSASARVTGVSPQASRTNGGCVTSHVCLDQSQVSQYESFRHGLASQPVNSSAQPSLCKTCHLESGNPVLYASTAYLDVPRTFITPFGTSTSKNSQPTVRPRIVGFQRPSPNVTVYPRIAATSTVLQPAAPARADGDKKVAQQD